MGVGDANFWQSASEVLLASSSGGLNSAVWVVDDQGATVFITDAAAQILGYAPVQMIGHRLLDYIHRDERDLAEQRLARTKSGLGEHIVATYTHATGKPVSVRVSSRPVFDGEEYLGIIATLDPVEISLVNSENAERLVSQQYELFARRRLSARLEMVADNLSEIVVIVGPDLRFEWVSKATETILGYSNHEMVGTLVTDYVHSDDIAMVSEFFSVLLSRPASESSIEIRLHCRDGSWVVAEGKVFNKLDVPDLACLFLRVADVTEKRNAEVALRDSEARYRGIVDNASDAIVTIEYGKIASFNAAASELVGVQPDAAVGKPVSEVFDSANIELGAKLFEERSNDDVVRFELVAHHSDGHAFPASVAISRSRSGTRITVVMRDLTDQRAYETQLQLMASRDPLTGLPNRIRIIEHIDQAMARARRHETAIAVLFLDLDRFKVVNDSLGHDAGDRLLLAASARIGAAIRDSDTLGRLGGDEFVVLCEDVVSSTEVAEIAKRIQVAFDAPFTLGRSEAFVTVSIGIALSDGVADRPSDLLRNADASMYQAKRAGRNRYEVFDESSRLTAHARLDFESAVRRCVERNELRLEYQPIFDLHTGAITGAEALVRWDRGPLGIVGPEDFIRSADEIGVSGTIGNWVCERAFRDCFAWQSVAPETTVSINISARQLMSERFVEDVAAIAHRVGISPTLVSLEVVERGLIDNPGRCQLTLESLSKLGFRMSLDNFGAGTLCLVYLRKFSFDVLKIDRTFIKSIDTGDDAEIIAAIVQLAHNLGMVVIAEGLECETTLAAVSTIGCEMAQGYLLARPQSVEELRGLMSSTTVKG